MLNLMEVSIYERSCFLAPSRRKYTPTRRWRSWRPGIERTFFIGTLAFHLSSKLTTRSMDRITVELYLGEGATGANCTVTSGGKWLFDPKSLVSTVRCRSEVEYLK